MGAQRTTTRLAQILLAMMLTGGGANLVMARNPATAGGQSHPVGSSQPDHDSALQARTRGDIMSLEDIIKRLGVRPTDRLVDVVIDQRQGIWIYTITYLTKVGRYRILTVNASNGQLLQDETK